MIELIRAATLTSVAGIAFSAAMVLLLLPAFFVMDLVLEPLGITGQLREVIEVFGSLGALALVLRVRLPSGNRRPPATPAR
jgi:hypothetical protein